jgi:hypothetical protein
MGRESLAPHLASQLAIKVPPNKQEDENAYPKSGEARVCSILLHAMWLIAEP